MVDHFGAIDVLINNAGIIEVGPLENMRRGDFEKSMQLHFWAPFNLIRQVIPHMRRAGGGRIVNISSIGGKGGGAASRALQREQVCARRTLRRLPRGARARRHPRHHRHARDDAHRFAGECHIQGRSRRRIHLVFSFDRAAVGGGERRSCRGKIVAACRRGQASLIIGLPARAAIIGNALFPSLTGEIMKLVSRILPGPVGVEGDELKSGRQARAEQRVPGWLSRLGDARDGARQRNMIRAYPGASEASFR